MSLFNLFKKKVKIEIGQVWRRNEPKWKSEDVSVEIVIYDVSNCGKLVKTNPIVSAEDKHALCRTVDDLRSDYTLLVNKHYSTRIDSIRKIREDTGCNYLEAVALLKEEES